MDGLLIVDKPIGPTSHDVVARVRRAMGERRIGHTGTLDPAASGVLPMVLGRATRLARFISTGTKAYRAVIRLGFATDTRDADGTAVGRLHQGPRPPRETVDRALDRFRGTFLQQPPAFSAKKIDGERSYRMARRATLEGAAGQAPAPLPAPVTVTATAVDLLAFEGDLVTVTIECSAGFYVRALAHDLGEALGVGAHLLALRRTRSGDATLDGAIALDALERDPQAGAAALIPLSLMLRELSSVRLTDEGVRHAVHGRNLGTGDIHPGIRDDGDGFVRLVDCGGELVAIATPVAGASRLLHPAVVLV